MNNITPPPFNAPRFRAWMNLAGANQAIADSTTTLVSVDTVDFDSHSYFDTVNFRYTPQRAGKYLFVGQPGWVHNIPASKAISAYIGKNGSVVYGGNSNGIFGESPALDVSVTLGQLMIALMDMNGTTDYADLRVRQVTGAGSTLISGQTFFSGHYLGT